jgi:hypothetical protein
MFDSEDEGVDIWIKVSCRAANLEKANKLSFHYYYDSDDKIIGFVDEEGNTYVPHLVLDINSGEGLLKSEREIEDKLGLQIVDYVDYGVSDVY